MHTYAAPGSRPHLLTLAVWAALAALPPAANAACTVSGVDLSCGPGDVLDATTSVQAFTNSHAQLNGEANNPVTVSTTGTDPLFKVLAPDNHVTATANHTVFNASATVLQADSFGDSTLKLQNSTINIGLGTAPKSGFDDPWTLKYALYAQSAGGGAPIIELNNVEFNNLSTTPGNVMNLVYANSSNTTPGPQVSANGVTTRGPVDYGFVIAGQGSSLLLENSQLKDVNFSAISNQANDYSAGRDIAQVTIRNSVITGANEEGAISIDNIGPNSRTSGFQLDIADSQISASNGTAIDITLAQQDAPIVVNFGVQDTHTPSTLVSNDYGIAAYSLASGAHQPITITTGSNTQINVSGTKYGDYGEGVGILAFSQDGDGAVTVRNAASIDVQGQSATGIDAVSNGPILVDSREGDIRVAGTDGSLGIYAGDADAPVNQTIHIMAGAIDVPNQYSSAVSANTSNGTITVDVTKKISAPGKGSQGVAVSLGNASADINVMPGGSILGGARDPDDWGSLSPYYYPSGILVVNRKASGVQATTINNQGSIGAMTDGAIASMMDPDTLVQDSPVVINNYGTITGYVDLARVSATGPQNTFNNYSSNSFVMRNFSDTNGDGVRDTKAVSVSNFGGPNALFNNAASGTVRFGDVAGNTATDTTGQYIPTTGNPGRALDASVYGLSRAGIAQGQLVNLATFINSGTIDLTGPAVGNVLAITGNPDMAASATGSATPGVFVSNGGALRVNAVLDAGMAPGAGTGSQADMLVVDRTQTGAGGATRVFVANQGGLGAQTTGSGIELVEVRDKTSGASDPGAFALGQRTAAGAYDYTLQHNGTGADAADGNWYLRSSLRPEIPLYQAVPALAGRMGLDMLGTYHDRLGEDYSHTAEGAAPASRRAAWGRIYGGNFKTRLDGSGAQRLSQYASDGPAYDMSTWGLQTGMDLYRRHGGAGQAADVAGLYFGYSHGSADVENAASDSRAGTVKLDGYSLGAYWTRKGAGGWYVDGVVQATYYGNIQADSSLGQRLSTDGWGLAASAESGYPFKLGAGWKLEPQVQLLYQYIDIKNASDDFGQVRYSSDGNIYARVGVRLDKAFTTASGGQFTPWAHANVWASPSNPSTTRFSTLSGANTVAMQSGLGGTWMQLGVGLAGQVAKNTSVFAAADYNQNIGGQKAYGVSGRIGLKIAW
ncbi:autotransporter family protein [Candidimonas nitroreducens]|uniref:Autotransporter domain-containing protein n=1 Tax=Candidimonas nitroreducens TaxID=683354 RepID=A0A225M4C5_9BURK|nr:autotransporter outer membrane beta-barrel domain-containing protein [Candidimonas nitroreducens]OWT56185.1 hypothetical protein CEY11_19340 [Candidimonas nitroreducens]